MGGLRFGIWDVGGLRLGYGTWDVGHGIWDVEYRTWEYRTTQRHVHTALSLTGTSASGSEVYLNVVETCRAGATSVELLQASSPWTPSVASE